MLELIHVSKRGPWESFVIIMEKWYKVYASGPFYYYGLTLIPAWISNYIHNNMCDEITYPFLNFNGATVEI